MQSLLDSVINVLQTEGEAVLALSKLVVDQQDSLNAIGTLIEEGTGEGKQGRLVLTGVGKAGIIAHKLSATFASTGTPSFVMHPTDARHGDLGMVQAHDVVLALSNSGSSEELVALVPSLRRVGCPIVLITGRDDSPLAANVDHVLSIGRVTEACPLGLAPSTSTTAMLALGDALALAIQAKRNFSPEDYARYHPGGALGRRLMTCAEVMRHSDRLALLAPSAAVGDAVREMTRHRTGSALIVDDQQQLLGLFSDGDLRRALATNDDVGQILTMPLKSLASCPCISIRSDELVASALRLCGERNIEDLPVVDDNGCILGLIDLQDLSKRGFAL